VNHSNEFNHTLFYETKAFMSIFDADLKEDEKNYNLYEKLYLVLASSFAVFLVLTNVLGIKLFRAPHDPEFALTVGILTYPFTFLLTDIVSEIYGKQRANYMVYIGFFMSILMLVLTQLAIHLDPHPFWVPIKNPYYPTHQEYQKGYESVFALNGILLFASMFAYMVAQLVDVWLYHFWKQLTKGKHLWLRNNGSTLISQLVDTAIVGSIFFYWGMGMSWGDGLTLMMTIYLYKAMLALLDTPLMYLSIWYLKKKLKENPHESTH
jgi:uncharacterized integral membrane protein (TIGR00697 family)